MGDLRRGLYVAGPNQHSTKYRQDNTVPFYYFAYAHEQNPVHKANLKYITRVSIYMVGEGAIIS